MNNIYLDWNIMTHMKQGKHEELLRLINDDPRFQIVYSTSHISDILVSYTGDKQQTMWIEEDLNFISQLTGNYCFYIENKEVVFDQRDPKELFENRLSESIEFNSYNFMDLIINMTENIPEAHAAALKIKDSPLSTEMLDSLQNPAAAENLRKLYPGLLENPTIGNLINIGFQNFQNLMQTDDYKSLRNALQTYLSLKPNGLIDKQPFDEIDNIYKDRPSTLDDLISNLKNDNSPQWFQDISLNYLLLDMHGYHEDKIKVDTRKKATMRNTIDDGFHSAFASRCDYYITNDTKSNRKTKEVYNKLNIETKVFSSDEFVAYYKEHLLNSDNPMIQIDTLHFEKSKEIIAHLKNLESNDEKVNNIIEYIAKSNDLLLQYGLVINSTLSNQHQILTALTALNSSISNLHDRLTAVEKCLDAYSSHLSAHDGHLDTLGRHLETHDKYLDLHDGQIDLLSDRIDNLE